MYYFSELVGKKIITEDGILVGKLSDLIFSVSDKPQITKLKIDAAKHSPLDTSLKIPLRFMKRISDTIIIEKRYEESALEENELYIHKNLMDQQIIDIKGNKVVRVNDVVIQDQPGLFIVGVDIGILGIFRWMHIDTAIEVALKPFGKKVQSTFLSWAEIQPLELARGKIILKQEQEKLEKIRAEDLADHLEKTTIQNASKLIQLMDKDFAADVISNLNLTYQYGLISSLSTEKAAEIIELIIPDDATDILLSLSERRREHIMSLLSPQKQKEINRLIKVSTTPIGEIMMTDYITVKPENTGKEIIEKIKRETKDYYLLNAVFVVNEMNQVIGAFNLHEMILNGLDTPVYKYMIQNVIVVHLKTPKEIALKKMIKYKIRSLPVIDDNKEILGIVVFEDLVKGMIDLD